MSNAPIFGIFNDEHKVLHAVEHLRHHQVNVTDVVSPYPIHGMDQALGLKRTRISVCAFMFGITGTSLALLMIWYMNIVDWPMDIGGKPNYAFFKNMPAFIPVTFESTVLCAAHGMVITFLLRCKILPGVEPEVVHPRVTDDHFVMCIEPGGKDDIEKIKKMVMAEGALEIR
ncbi:MAG: DUF3341 domain-containing protein [Bacteroidetes bacterium]|nr:DUF3341 domain-containing protein [Bacteroidota bacterium]